MKSKPGELREEKTKKKAIVKMKVPLETKKEEEENEEAEDGKEKRRGRNVMEK